MNCLLKHKLMFCMFAVILITVPSGVHAATWHNYVIDGSTDPMLSDEHLADDGVFNLEAFMTWSSTSLYIAALNAQSQTRDYMLYISTSFDGGTSTDVDLYSSGAHALPYPMHYAFVYDSLGMQVTFYTYDGTWQTTTGLWTGAASTAAVSGRDYVEFSLPIADMNISTTALLRVLLFTQTSVDGVREKFPTQNSTGPAVTFRYFYTIEGLAENIQPNFLPRQWNIYDFSIDNTESSHSGAVIANFTPDEDNSNDNVYFDFTSAVKGYYYVILDTDKDELFDSSKDYSSSGQIDSEEQAIEADWDGRVSVGSMGTTIIIENGTTYYAQIYCTDNYGNITFSTNVYDGSLGAWSQTNWISGNVSAGGAGCAGAYMDAQAENDWSTSRNAYADGSGSYIIYGLDGTKTYNVKASSDPFASEYAREISISGEGQAGEDITLIWGTKVEGTVTDYLTGFPVDNVRIRLNGWFMNSISEETTTGIDGAYIDHAPPGSPYYINVYDNNNDYADLRIQTSLTEGTTVQQDFVLPPGGGVTGTVYYKGMPLYGKQVEFFSSWNNFYSNESYTDTTTDSNGVFYKNGLASGEYILGVNVDSGTIASAYQAVEIFEGQVKSTSTEQNLVFDLIDGAAITGLVTDSLGNPLESADVSLCWMESGGAYFENEEKTDSNGYYEIVSVATAPVNTYSLSIGKSGYVPQNILPYNITSTGTITRHFTLLLATGIISGTITNNTLAADGPYYVYALSTGTIFIGNSEPDYVAMVMGPGPYALMVSSDIAYYNVGVYDADLSKVVGRAIYVSTNTTNADIVIDTGTTISGTVTRSDTGAPLALVSIQIMNEDQPYGFVESGADGTFTADYLPVDISTFTLMAVLNGFTTAYYLNASTDTVGNDFTMDVIAADDITRPIISYITPGLDRKSLSAATTVQAIVSDGAGSGVNTASILLKIDDSTVPHVYDSGAGVVSYYKSDYTEGVHSAYLECYDQAGTPLKACVTWYFTVDLTIPTVTFTAYDTDGNEDTVFSPENGYPESEMRFEISSTEYGDYTLYLDVDNNGIFENTTDYFLNNYPVAYHVSMTTESSTTLDWSGYMYDYDGNSYGRIGEGTYIIRLQLDDTYDTNSSMDGHVVNSSITVTVDNTALANSITSPVASLIIRGPDFTVDYTLAEACYSSGSYTSKITMTGSPFYEYEFLQGGELTAGAHSVNYDGYNIGMIEGLQYNFTLQTYDLGGNSYYDTSVSNVLYVYPPQQVTTLTSSIAGEGDTARSVLLTWIAPGDDGTMFNLGGGSEFVIQYSSYVITWSTSVSNTIRLSTSGVNPLELQSYNVTGLQSDTTFYFRLWTKDDSSTYSDISVGTTLYFADAIPPAAVNNLYANAGAQIGGVRLTWDTPGDDNWTDPIASTGAYKIFYSTDAAETGDTDKAQVTISTHSIAPFVTVGTTIGGLDPGGTYYFYLWTADEKMNWSSVSNQTTSYATAPLLLNDTVIENWSAWRGVVVSSAAGGNSEFAHKCVINGADLYYTGYATEGGNDNVFIRKVNASGVTQWTKYYNGADNGDDRGYGMAADGNGDIYVSGYTYVEGENKNIWLRKYDADGTVLWTQTYNGPINMDDIGYDVTVDGSNNVYLTGYIRRAAEENDVWLRKYDSSGSEVWTSTYNYAHNNDDAGTGIALAGSDIYISGYVTDSVEDRNILLAKFNSSGLLQWTTYYNQDSLDDEGWGVTVSGNNIYVVGFTSQTGQSSDMWLTKFDSNANFLWTRTYNGSVNGRDEAYGVAMDQSGYVYLTGLVTDVVGESKIVTVKYDADGTLQWSNSSQTAGSNSNVGIGVAIDGGTVYLTGVADYTATAEDILLQVYNQDALQKIAITTTAVTTSSISYEWGDTYFESTYTLKSVDDDGILATLQADTTFYTLTGLGANVSTNVYVSGFNSFASTNAFSQVFYTLAAVPTNPAPGEVSITSMTISWDDVGATRYAIDKAPDVNGTPGAWANVVDWAGAITSPGYIATGLEMDTTYWFRMKSYNGDQVLNQTPGMALNVVVSSAPTLMAASEQSNSSIKWTWLDNSNFESGFKVYAAGGGAPLVTLPANTQEWTETGLPLANNLYERYVVSFNLSGNSGVRASTAGYTYATEPSGLALYSTSPDSVYFTSASIKWTNVNATRYGVEQADDNNGTPAGWAMVKTWDDNVTTFGKYDITGLAYDTTYYFRVYSYNQEAHANPIPSDYIKVITAPRSPGMFYGSVQSTTSIKWQWADASSSEWGFYIYDDATHVVVGTVSANTTQWTETGLSPNVKYYRYARAFNEFTVSSFTATANKCTYATIPTGLNVTTISTFSVTINWTDDGNATQFTVQRNTSTPVTETEWFTLTAAYPSAQDDPPYNDATLWSDTTAWFRLRSINQEGAENSTPSSYVRAVTLAETPTGFNGVAASSTTINWSWTDNSSTELRYEIYNSTSHEKVGEVADDITAWQESGFTVNTVHSRYVIAVNESGNSLDSNYTTTYTHANKPTEVFFTGKTTDTATIQWLDNSNPPGTIYAIYISSDSNFQKQTSSESLTATSFEFDKLMVNTTYFTRLKTRNGDDIWTTETTSVSTATLANMPGVAIADVGITSMSFTISPVENPGYTLYRVLVDSTVDVNGDNLAFDTTAYLVTSGSDWGLGATEEWKTKADWEAKYMQSISTNTAYKLKIQAKNAENIRTGYAEIEKCTLAAQPALFSVISIATTTITTDIVYDGNPPYTQYSFKVDPDGDGGDFNTTQWVASADGTLTGDVNVSWSSNTAWGIKDIVDLSANTLYKFTLTARNEELVAIEQDTIVSTYTLCSLPPAPTVTVTADTFSLDMNLNPGSNPAAPTDTLFAVVVDTDCDTIVDLNPAMYVDKDNKVITATPQWYTDSDFGAITVVGLSTNTIYHVLVKAKNGNGVETAAGPRTSIYTRAAPPINPNIPVLTQNTITVDWDANENPSYTDYTVQYYHDYPSLPPYSFTDAYSTTNATIGIHDSLNPATTHFYQICAYNKDGLITTYTAGISTFTNASVPPIPTLTVAGATEISIDVNAGDNNASNTVYSVVVDTTNNALSFDTTGYLQSDGTVGPNETWLSETVWGTKLVVGLTPNTIYRFKAKSKDTQFNKPSYPDEYSSEVWKYTYANPPTGTAISDVYPSSVTVTWSANSNPVSTEYELYRSINNINYDFITAVIGTAGSVTFTDTGLASNTRYWYKLRTQSVEGSYTIFDSTVSGVTTVDTPVSPSVVITSSTKLTVDINAGSNPSNTEYAIAVDTDTDGSSFNTISYVQSNGSLNSTEDWQTDTLWSTVEAGDLAANTINRIKVKARNSGNVESAFSAVIASYTLANMPSATATAADSSSQITFSWSTDNPLDTDYSAVLSASADFSAATTSDTLNTSAVFTALTPNTTYYVKVRSINEDGIGSAYTSAANRVTECDAPSSVSFSAKSTSTLSVTWSAGDNTGLTRYIVHGSSADFTAGDILASTVTASAATITSLAANTTYSIKVYAVNHESVPTTYSGAASAATSPDLPLNAGFTEVFMTSMTFNWTSHDDKAGPYYYAECALDYNFTEGVTNSGWLASQLNADFTGLSANTKYYFRIKTKGHNGEESAYSSAVSTYTLSDVPAAGAFSNQAESSIRANWSQNSNPSGTYYYAEKASNGAFDTGLSNSGWTTALYYDFTGLSSNTTYHFRVKARNYSGFETDTVALGSESTSPDGPGTASITNVGISSVTANWTDNSGKAGPYYYAECSPDAQFVSAVLNSGWVTSFSSTFTALPANTQYYFRVKTKGNNDEESSWTSLGGMVTLSSVPVVSANITASTWYPAATLLTFTNGMDFGSGAVSYYRYIIDTTATHAWTGSETQWLSGTVSTTPATSSSGYYLHVRSYNADNTATTETLDFGPFQIDVTVPDAPSVASVVLTTCSIVWNAAAANDTGGSGLDAAPYSFDGGLAWQAGASITTISLTANTSAAQTLVYRDIAGNQSSSVFSKVYTRANEPIAAAFSDVTGAGITANWTGNGNSSLTRYLVELSTESKFAADISSSGWITNVSYSFNGLLPDTSYYMRVRAVNVDNVQTSTVTLGVRMTLSNTPSNLVLTNILDTSVRLVWAGAGIARFGIERSTDSTTWTYIRSYSHNLTTTTYTDTSLNSQTTYYYRVRGYNNAGVVSDGYSNVAAKPGLKKMDTASGGTETTDDGTSVEIPAATFDEDVYIVIRTDPKNDPKEVAPADITEADGKIDATKMAQIPDTVREFVAYDNTDTEVTSFNNSVIISIPYPDENNDGYVDGVIPRIKVDALRMFTLDETGKLWKIVAKSEVNKQNKSVQSEVEHFSVYSLIGLFAASDLTGVIVYPNPFRPGSSGQFDATDITFRNLTATAKIRIFTAAGELVATLYETDNDGEVTWDARNAGGERVATGMYLYSVTDDNNNTMTGYIGIVR